MKDKLNSVVQRLVREAGGADNCRIHITKTVTGWEVCCDTQTAGLYKYKSVIVKREAK